MTALLTKPKPLVLVDVDGPLIPTYAQKKPQGYTAFQASPRYHGGTGGKTVRIWLNKRHGAWLKALDHDLVWATAWEASANKEIGSRIGLPTMPHISFTTPFLRNPDNSHWKLNDLLMYADGRPFVWLDDGITGADTVRVAVEYPAPALLYRVDPRWGLTYDDMVNVWEWLKFVS